MISRFSQDIQLIDKQLPDALQTIVTRKNRISYSNIVVIILTAAEIFKLSMQIIVLFVAQKWLVVSLPVCMLVVYVVQKVYLCTSRQLRFLELEARAGIFSSFLESVCILSRRQSFSV